MTPPKDPLIARSLWAATAHPAPETPPLIGAADTEVAVVGGGITGLSAALHLAERGQDVTLIDAQASGWGASGRNGGQLNPGLKLDPDAIVARFGADRAARLLHVSGGAPAFTLALVDRLHIACDAVHPGWVQPAHSAASLDRLTARADQWARHGVDLQVLDRTATADLLGTEAYSAALLDPRGGHLHPLNYALGLAHAAQAAGARLHGASPALDLTRDGATHVLTTPQGLLRAGRVILATNGYTDDLATPLRRTLVPIQSIQVATAPLAPDLLRSVLPGHHAVSDSRRVTVYYKRDGAGRLLMGGRGDYSETTTTRLFETLRDVTRKTFPQLGDIAFDYAWGGTVAMTADHLPHLTPLGDGVISATGYNGRGLALSGVMGRVLADWALGQHPDDLDVPITAPRPIPLHRFRKLGVRAAIALFRLQDALGR